MSHGVKNALSYNVEEFFKKFLDTDLDADDFFLVHRNGIDTSYGKIFMKIQSAFFYVKLRRDK